MPRTRYDSIAITLHWVMAIAFLLMLTSGVVMSYVDIPKSLKFQMYQWHKSLGVLVLLTFVVRLGWRLFHYPPALPASIHGMEAKLAKLGHWGLYAFMLAVPLSGWLMVSSSVYGLPTIVFGWFEWPHIPNVAGNNDVEQFAKTAHWMLALTFFALIVAHVGAVIKHWIMERENLLTRMWWTKGETE